MLSIVKYKCGCIGFPPNKKGEILIIRPCDLNIGNYRDISISYNRQMTTPLVFKELSDERVDLLFRQIGDLVGDGYDMREIRKIISHKEKI